MPARAFVLHDMIIDHRDPRYRLKWRNAGYNQYNGAYYYSKEIVDNIIPRIRTDRNWITVNVQGAGCDHAIVFIHNNRKPSNYEWLSKYEDLILVCGIPETVDKVKHLGKAIYLPISVDVAYVEKFRRPKTKGAAYVGRPSKKKYGKLPARLDLLEGLRRENLLARMAEYKTVYAVGRCAIEAKILGCELKPYDERFPDVERWKILDNREAAEMLQALLDRIDGGSDG